MQHSAPGVVNILCGGYGETAPFRAVAADWRCGDCRTAARACRSRRGRRAPGGSWFICCRGCL